MLDGTVLDLGSYRSTWYVNPVNRSIIYNQNVGKKTGIAWIIIPMELEYVTENFKFSSWNLFVAACAVPSILIGLWLFFFPESPKFLLECGEADAALDVLRDMYASNYNDDGANFPVSNPLTSQLFEI